jgi:hypothetical protein
MSEMNSPLYLFTWVTAACVAGAIWSFGIKLLMLDWLRERLFELRFKLFEMGMEDQIKFDDPAYRSFELLFCGLLRFAHRITFLSYLFSARQRSRASKEKDYVDVAQQIALRVSRLNPTTQEKFNDIAQKAREALIYYMIFSSIPLFVFIMSLVLAKRVGLIKLDGAKEKIIVPIEQEAYRCEERSRLRVALA